MLELVDICKHVGGQTILNKINLKIHDGEFFSILGPSGCGKTTLLRLIAGLDQPSSGQILLNGKPIHHFPAQQRPFNMVFQKYALFPHLSVLENVGFGLRMKKMPSYQVQQKSLEAIEMVGLKGFESRKPETLSGGQAQRVALARALVNEPEVLLLDEPLSALDLKMREHMQIELLKLQKRLGLTFIYITHDQEEAMTMSDRIGVMNASYIEQVSFPEDLYLNPKSIFTARFIGQTSCFPGQLIEQGSVLSSIKLSSGQIIKGKLLIDDEAVQIGDRVEAYIRPEAIHTTLRSKSLANCDHVLQAMVTRVVFRGAQVEVYAEVEGVGVVTILTDEHKAGEHKLSAEQKIYLQFSSDEVNMFKAQDASQATATSVEGQRQ
jgi:spermidine/putrescine transport system ATP-binding protein